MNDGTATPEYESDQLGIALTNFMLACHSHRGPSTAEFLEARQDILAWHREATIETVEKLITGWTRVGHNTDNAFINPDELRAGLLLMLEKEAV